MPKERLPESTVKTLHALCFAGYTAQQVAWSAGISRQWLLQLFADYGMSTPAEVRKNLPPLNKQGEE